MGLTVCLLVFLHFMLATRCLLSHSWLLKATSSLSARGCPFQTAVFSTSNLCLQRLYRVSISSFTIFSCLVKWLTSLLVISWFHMCTHGWSNANSNGFSLGPYVPVSAKTSTILVRGILILIMALSWLIPISSWVNLWSGAYEYKETFNLRWVTICLPSVCLWLDLLPSQWLSSPCSIQVSFFTLIPIPAVCEPVEAHFQSPS